ncbi:hypothetical protein MA16_Dca023669 [Dendrobium catenatum]|uniref:Uncharacterized protein n=1 Tax=Dendrobium catenatum TaxID=906689 RepID=A0A2I0VDC4_9ASPA|nr:hypothetical protein MA16_Dca023669 [Dendrobium catenatum]
MTTEGRRSPAAGDPSEQRRSMGRISVGTVRDISSSPPAFGDGKRSFFTGLKTSSMMNKPLIINEGGLMKKKQIVEVPGKGKNKIMEGILENSEETIKNQFEKEAGYITVPVIASIASVGMKESETKKPSNIEPVLTEQVPDKKIAEIPFEIAAIEIILEIDSLILIKNSFNILEELKEGEFLDDNPIIKVPDRKVQESPLTANKEEMIKINSDEFTSNSNGNEGNEDSPQSSKKKISKQLKDLGPINASTRSRRREMVEKDSQFELFIQTKCTIHPWMKSSGYLSCSNRPDDPSGSSLDEVLWTLEESEGESARECLKEDSYYWSVKDSFGIQRRSGSLSTLGECEQPKGSLPILGECEQLKGSLPTLGECERMKDSLPTLGKCERMKGSLPTLGECERMTKKKNISLGHLVTYILKKKYDLVHPIQDFEEPLYYNDESFRAIFHKETHVISDSEEEPEPAPPPAPAGEPNYQDLVHRFDRLETHFDQRFDQIETHLQQQDAQHNQNMGWMREQIDDISSNMLMISSYVNFFNAPPPPPPDQGPLE